MRTIRRLAISLAVFAVGGSWPLAEPPPSDRFSVTLTTPPVRWDRAADGAARVVLEGHETRAAPVGAPDVPTRTLRVAIPFDATPRLEWSARGWRAVAGPRPRAVPVRVHRLDEAAEAKLRASRGDALTRLDVLQGTAVEEERPDRAFYDGGRSYPERAAWLGETGVLRDQRYVEVHVAPLRWDGASRRLVAASALDVTVHFDGRAPGEPAAAPPAARFENVYRESFVNYEQGRLFRRAAGPTVRPTRKAAGAGGPAPFKISVREDGIVRLDHATLDAAGVLAAGADPTQWRLTTQGEPVPLQLGQLGGGNPSLLEPGEWVQFYGQRLDHEPETRLNTDRPNTDLDLFEAADFTDTSVYWLDVAAGAGQPAMTEVDAAPACGGCAVPGWFDETLVLEVDDSYFPLGPEDPWYWSPVLSANFPPADRTIPVALPGLASGADPAEIRVSMRGLSPYTINADTETDPDHATRVTVLDDGGGTLHVDDQTWDGRIVFEHVIVHGGGGAPLTADLDVHVEALVVPLAANDVVVDRLEVDYRRSFTAEGDRLEFEWPDGDHEFEIGGLTTVADVEVYELSTPAANGVESATRLANVAVLPGGPPYTVRFRIDDVDPGSPARRFVVAAGPHATPALADVVQDTPSDLKNQANQADLIVIAHPDVLDQGPGPCTTPDPTGCLPELLAWRATVPGGDLTSTVVLIEDVEDEFGFGLSGPDAIREFLRWVMSDAPGEGWADPKPAYVMLLGDGSYDYKAGAAAANFVHTQVMFRDRYEFGYYASDNRLAAVVGDDELTDLVVGRIPARDAADANRMLEKILAYEQAPPPGPWRESMLLLADRGHTGTEAFEAEAFELINQRGLDQIDAPPYETTHLKYYTDYYTQMSAAEARGAMHDDIVAEVNGDEILGTGSALVQFAGHGNFFIWSDDSYWDERDLNPGVPNELEFDTFELFNGGRLPWMMAHNCLTGGFHILPDNTLGENWLRREGGGSMAVFAPSGLSFDFLGLRASELVWKSLFGPTKARDVGEVVMAAVAGMCGQGSIEPCQHYVLLGDPASKLQIRSTAPATGISTTSGNMSVTLDWAASATPGATYDVYRFTSLLARVYIKANASPITGTSFVDTGLENAKAYYYHVVAVDPDGFESRWSHFNSDCAIDGPDCLRETPINPDPPSPPDNVGLRDLGIGTAFEVSWDPPSETDLAKYTIHYGTSSGEYTQSLDVGLGTKALLPGLTAGQTYYVALTATNTSQKTSAFSQELSDSPLEAFGFRPPAFIDTLSVAADGGDALLSWDEVATDPYGKPTTVAQYEILRGTSADWTNAGLSPIATCGAPCSEYRDVGALGSPTSYHYRVRAVDVAGLSGGLGSEYPRWTVLEMEREVVEVDGQPLATGDIRLVWSPVSTTIAGGPADVLRYRVYASPSPFTRQDVEDGLLPSPTLVDGTSLWLTPDAGSIFYSVVVEDVRGNMSPF